MKVTIAPLSSRALAALTDALLVGAGFGLFVTHVLGYEVGKLPSNVQLASVVVCVLYRAFFESYLMKGQTLGKQLFHLRVVNERGHLLSLPESLFRGTLQGVIWQFPPVWLFDVLWPIFHGRRRSLHDLGAKTYVVQLESAPARWFSKGFKAVCLGFVLILGLALIGPKRAGVSKDTKAEPRNIASSRY